MRWRFFHDIASWGGGGGGVRNHLLGTLEGDLQDQIESFQAHQFCTNFGNFFPPPPLTNNGMFGISALVPVVKKRVGKHFLPPIHHQPVAVTAL